MNGFNGFERWKEIKYGIVVPVEKPPAPVVTEKPSEPPKLKGWSYSKCGDRYYKSEDVAFRKRAIEDLYIAVDPGGSGIMRNDDGGRRERLLKMIDALAIELVGGVPEGFEEYT